MVKIKDGFIIFLIVGIITLFGNWAGFKINPLDALVGMLILILIAFIGWIISKKVPFNLPAIVYVSLLGIIATSPWTPGREIVLKYVNNVEFLATCTPVLAYAGVSIGKDIEQFRELGWQIVVLSFVVFTGTFVGSAFVAQLILKFTGTI